MGTRASAHPMSFPVKDLECSRRFYEQVLGLRPISRPNLGALGGAWHEARGHLRSSGVEMFESRESGQMWIRDPDGHVIELTVPAKTAGPGPASQLR